MILLYAFSNQWGTNISRQTLLHLQELLGPQPTISFQRLLFHPKNFYQNHIVNHQYSHIIGLGDYYGTADRIILETTAKNVYGAAPIHPLLPITIDLNVPPSLLQGRVPAGQVGFARESLKISHNAGTYNCNWLMFNTQHYLNLHSPSTFHLFFHLPKMHRPSLLAGQLADILDSLGILNLN